MSISKCKYSNWKKKWETRLKWWNCLEKWNFAYLGRCSSCRASCDPEKHLSDPTFAPFIDDPPKFTVHRPISTKKVPTLYFKHTPDKKKVCKAPKTRSIIPINPIIVHKRGPIARKPMWIRDSRRELINITQKKGHF